MEYTCLEKKHQTPFDTCLFVCWSGEHLALEYAPDGTTAGSLQNPYAFTQISKQFTLPHCIGPAGT